MPYDPPIHDPIFDMEHHYEQQIADLRTELAKARAEVERLTAEFDRPRVEEALLAAELARAKWLLGQILDDLPQSRDWLNPDIEREARAIVGGER